MIVPRNITVNYLNSLSLKMTREDVCMEIEKKYNGELKYHSWPWYIEFQDKIDAMVFVLQYSF